MIFEDAIGDRVVRRVFVFGFACALVFVIAGVAVFHLLDRTPGELLRYAEHRLYGHTKLERVLMPILREVRIRVERPVPPLPLSSLGKGVQPDPPQRTRFDVNGMPSPDWSFGPSDQKGDRRIIVNDVATLVNALREARAGDDIEIVPGIYRINRNLGTRNPGTADKPVIVRGVVPNSVRIEVIAGEGFQVTQPYWVFENLSLYGVCAADDYCEHAFHVVGQAKGVVIRNNLIAEFNAHIKVNGLNGAFPDDGLIQHNTLINSRTRVALKPVTPIDIVAASRWLVADNVIADFVKLGRDGHSYGVFMKGAGAGGRIERNLVICTLRDISEPASKVGKGTRVGISMGGGGTGSVFCRDRQCVVEHTKGVIANNIVAHCNDFGIDINRSNQILVAHNTLINTAGIDLRGTRASANVRANLLDGRIRSRDGSWLAQLDNHFERVRAHLLASDNLDFSWAVSLPDVVTVDGVTDDFCRRKRSKLSAPAAFATVGPCH